MIVQTFVKPLCAEATTHGHLAATLSLVRDHDLDADDIERIVIAAGLRTVRHTGDPAKRFPSNKETADHSSHFLTTMAVLARQITPSIYSEANYRDPRVREFSSRVALEHDPQFDPGVPAAEVTIHLRNGIVLSRRTEKAALYVAPQDLLSDEALERKFTECAGALLNERRIAAIVDTGLQLDKLPDLQALMRSLEVRMACI